MFGIFIKHGMHELILFKLLRKKVSYKYMMFRNVIVQYKRTVTNTFKQNRTSKAPV